MSYKLKVHALYMNFVHESTKILYFQQQDLA